MPAIDPSVIPPPDPDQKIWRYMNFTKFVSMLETQSLFFCRSDRLGDHFEGSLPLAHRRDHFEDHSESSLAQGIVELSAPHMSQSRKREQIARIESEIAETNKTARELHRWVRQWVLVNCWHMNNRESNAMWEIYAKSNEAIAIRSTYRNLSDCLGEALPELYIGVVNYLDYLVDSIQNFTLLSPYFQKRMSFEYENELRAVLFTLPVSEILTKPLTEYDNPNKRGVQIGVDLPSLVEEIVVAPQAPDWFLELVGQIVKKYDPRLPEPKQSKLDDPAIF